MMIGTYFELNLENVALVPEPAKAHYRLVCRVVFNALHLVVPQLMQMR